MILLLGDFMIDHYLWGKSNRISPEAPVPVIDIEKEEDRLGGAGNVLNNILSLDCNIIVSTVLGNGYDRILKLLDRKCINTDGIFIDEDRETIIKSRIVADNHQVIRYDIETKDYISKEYEEKIFSFVKKNIDRVDIVLLSDYEKGVLTPSLTQKIVELSNLKEKKLIIDPKSDFSKYKNGYMLKPNRKELSVATGIDVNSRESLLKAGWDLKKKLNLKYLLVTLSEEGMGFFGEEFIHIPTVAKEVYDVTGAGDTVLATLGCFLSKGNTLIDAINLANIGASIVVGKVGSAIVSTDEIFNYKRVLNNSTENKIIPFDAVEELSLKDKKVVFTNGCFDILHLGHVKYLQKAKSLGDILIVGVNSNSSVSRLKGSNRPINDEYDRAYILASLETVDYVVIFEEDTPYKLIKQIKPNILVKGADYKDKEIIGSDLVEDVRLIDFVKGRSTTNIIKRMNSC